MTTESNGKIKVGLPSALMGYRLNPLLDHFFTNLGAEVVYSEQTNSQILEEGAALVNENICTPFKIYFGHVARLLKSCDYIPALRFVSEEDRTYTCPKFMGLRSLLMNISFREQRDKFLPLEINMRKFTPHVKKGEQEKILKAELAQIGEVFGKTEKQTHDYYHDALLVKEKFEQDMANGMILPYDMKQPENPDLSIGVIGHPYNIYDSYLSMNILSKLYRMNVKAITIEMVGKEISEKAADTHMSKKLFWNYEREIVGSVAYLLENNLVDGILFLDSFPCGPDSLMSVFLNQISNNLDGKLMAIVLAELDSDTGLKTRVEAFVNSIRGVKAGVI